jgi:hypothetical protein
MAREHAFEVLRPFHSTFCGVLCDYQLLYGFRQATYPDIRIGGKRQAGMPLFAIPTVPCWSTIRRSRQSGQNRFFYVAPRRKIGSAT